jgi:hypothetical protein
LTGGRPEQPSDGRELTVEEEGGGRLAPGSFFMVDWLAVGALVDGDSWRTGTVARVLLWRLVDDVRW